MEKLEAARQEEQRDAEVVAEFESRLMHTTPYGTFGLVTACGLIFIAEMVMGGSTNNWVLVLLGANFGPLVRDGQWWRLIGSSFLHIGLTHLVFNLSALLMFGPTVERYYGNVRFLALYALAAVGGSLLSSFTGTRLSAGASGALFGVLAAYALIGYRYRDGVPSRFRSRLSGGFMAAFVLYSLVYGFGEGGVDNACHLGGLLAGLVFAMVVSPAVSTKTPSGRPVFVAIVASYLVGELVALGHATQEVILPVQPTVSYQAPGYQVQIPAYFVPEQKNSGQFAALDANVHVSMGKLLPVREIDAALSRQGVQIHKSYTESAAGRSWYTVEATNQGEPALLSLEELGGGLFTVWVDTKDAHTMPSVHAAVQEMMSTAAAVP